VISCMIIDRFRDYALAVCGMAREGAALENRAGDVAFKSALPI
jgi:hypothetical protein